ncbi:L,D-transpeptidase [Actinoplanes sp. NPDC051851]|uniref:L,D-transpeptidase n=1 Tax=Actinoplanes sp. NPDC051851 TaxID=3154753 RepID=UPI0034238FC3
MPIAPSVGPNRTRVLLGAAAVLVVAALIAAFVLVGRHESRETATPGRVSPAASATPSAPASFAVHPLEAAAAPDGLMTIKYAKGPSGLPADPDQTSTEALTEGLHPTKSLVLYDAPGGKPRAYLPPKISGLRTLVPIAARENGWTAVLVPSVNRRIGWIPDDAGFTTEELHDQIVVRLGKHTLTWLRDSEIKDSWTVGVGTAATPTPLGRTYVMGQTGTSGEVYAGLDALVLGSVPEDPDSMAEVFQLAHTGIHAWYRSSTFGKSASNGCVRMPKAAQKTLLAEVPSGTPITILP